MLTIDAVTREADAGALLDDFSFASASAAANKRRVSPEELKLLFQSAEKLHAERTLIKDSSFFYVDLFFNARPFSIWLFERDSAFFI